MTDTLSSHASGPPQDTSGGPRPTLTSCGRFSDFLDLPDRILLHAGPPFARPEQAPAPVVNSAISAVLFEGWADTRDAARSIVLAGEIPLHPAQDFGLVTPLAFVATPGTAVLRVVDAAGQAPPRFCPLNDGGADAALRFGEPPTAERVARLGAMAEASVGLQAALGDGIELLPLMAQAIAAGDDLHGNVAAMTALLAEILTPSLSGASLDYVTAAPLFGLNPVMGACAMMLAATTQADGIIAAGGNGVDFGWKRADAPAIWQTARALPPVGPLFKDIGPGHVLPAIGDSAVIDACGFGGAILRHAPSLVDGLSPFHPAETFEPQASAAFAATHPLFPRDIRIGLSAARIPAHPGIMLAMLDRTGQQGIIGRGLAPWPKV